MKQTLIDAFLKGKKCKDTILTAHTSEEIATGEIVEGGKIITEEKEEKKIKYILHHLSPLATIQYYENFLTSEEQKSLYNHLLTDPNVKWQQGEYKGRKLPRLLWSMRDEKVENFNTKYQEYTGTNSGPWTKPVEAVKILIEGMFPGLKLGYCQLNYYRNGNDYINWHGDRELCPGDSIYSLSLGCTRTFLLTPKTVEGKFGKKTDIEGKLGKKTNIRGKITEYKLLSGSLLVMNYEAGNKEFLHSLQKEPHIREGRINITFRVK